MDKKFEKINFLIPKDEISFEFFRSSGPGGQNINKVSSGVRLRWDIEKNKTLSEEQKEKIKKKYLKKITGSGDLIIESRKFRSQIENKKFALEKLQEIINKVLQEKERAMKVKIPIRKKEQRLTAKKRTSQKKKLRKISKEDLL